MLNTIKTMMEEPNADNPLEPEIAQQMATEPAKFAETAKKWTADFAT